MKRLLPVIVLILTFTVFIGFSFALELKNIGNLSLDGKTYSEWWYSGTNPTFSGTAAAASAVKVTINNTTYDATADSTGSWMTATTEPVGDYDVSIVGDDDTYSFKLHLGQNVPSNIGSTTSGTAPSSTTVPSTGSNQLVSLLFSLGILLLASYFYFWGFQTNSKTNKFEKYFLDS